MAWKKVMLEDDPITGFTGTAYRLPIIDSAGDVVELAHGAASKVLTSGGAAADPTWEDAAGGPHALDAGQTDVTITTPADDEVLSYEAGTWVNKTAAEAGLATDGHLLGSTEHGADTLANLNAKVSDATLDDSSDTRTPTDNSVGNSQVDNTATDIALNQLILTPKAAGDGTVGGTLYYCNADDHAYLYVSA